MTSLSSKCVTSPSKNVSRTPPLGHPCTMWTKPREEAVTQRRCGRDKEQQSAVCHIKVHPSDDLSTPCLTLCDDTGGGDGGGRGPRLPQLGRHERWAWFNSFALWNSYFGVDAAPQLASASVCVSVFLSVRISAHEFGPCDELVTRPGGHSGSAQWLLGLAWTHTCDPEFRK